MLPDKENSHYGPFSSQPGLDSFIQVKGIATSFDEGYFLHLVTDYLFYNRFLKTWSPTIYEDYNILNGILVQKYEVVLPDSIKGEVKFHNGALSLLDEESVCKFIDSVGRLNIRQMVLKRKSNLKGNLGEELNLI